MSDKENNKAKPTSEQKIKVARNTVRDELTRSEKALARQKKKIALQKRKMKVLDTALGETDDKLVTGEEIQLSSVLEKQIEDGEIDMVFKPNPGPQYDFLAASEQEVLYGGAAGGGKSYAMLMDPLRWAHNKHMRALLLRRSMGDLTEMISLSQDLYPRIFKGAKFTKANNTWTFPSGATLWFSYFDKDDDRTMYQGQAFTWIGIDEITQYATPYAWEWLRSRLRTADPELSANLAMRCTANPGGVGEHWVQKMFVDPAVWGDSFWARNLETGDPLIYLAMHGIPDHLVGKPLFKRRFIPARLQDNPALMHDTAYITNLMSLPEVERRRLLQGEWGVSESSAFSEFRLGTHVINPHEYPDEFPNGKPPQHWRRFKMCDWGFQAFSAVLWCAIDHDGLMYIYRELYVNKHDPEALAELIMRVEYEGGETRPIPGVLDAQCWENRGTNSKSIADTMISMGIKWQRAPKGPGSRLNGKAAIHRGLRVRPESGEPMLKFFTSCANTIRTLPILPLDPKNPEDIDTTYPEDHIYDALRYGLTSMLAHRGTHPDMAVFLQKQGRKAPVDSKFGW